MKIYYKKTQTECFREQSQTMRIFFKFNMVGTTRGTKLKYIYHEYFILK